MAILMMFSKSLRLIPFEQAIPFSKDDLLLVMDKDVAFRLANIVDEDNKPFSISYTMGKEAVFHCDDFDKRCEKFSDIMDARLERYFDTKKTDYLFFDLEEQKRLQTIFSLCNLNCSVIIYMMAKDGFKEVNLEELNYKDSRKCLSYLSKLKARSVLRPDEFYKLKQVSSKKSEETKRKFEQMSKEQQEKRVKVYFERYSKLSGFKTQKDVSQYYRKLTIKYHPDKGGDEEIFRIIAEDFNVIKKSKWYLGLPTE